MTTETKSYTAGAERAARRLYQGARWAKPLEIGWMATVISEETHDAEMLEALKYVIEFYGHDDQEAEQFPNENCAICKAKAVIAKVEGR